MRVRAWERSRGRFDLSEARAFASINLTCARKKPFATKFTTLRFPCEYARATKISRTGLFISLPTFINSLKSCSPINFARIKFSFSISNLGIKI